MSTTQSQIKITIPLALKEYVESKAKKYGMPIAGYVRHLILNDVSDMDFPVYKASSRTEKKAQKAIKDKTKSVVVEDIDQFFKSL